MKIKTRLASVAVLASLAATTAAPALAGTKTAASAKALPQTVGQRFGCRFTTGIAESFIGPSLVPKGSMRCKSRRLVDLRLVLLKNGVQQKDALVVHHVRVPARTDAFASRKNVHCLAGTYRSLLVVRLFHNGTSTVLRAESPALKMDNRCVVVRPTPRPTPTSTLAP